MVIREAVKTDIGKRRSENQDAFGFFPEMSLYVVADGMGGHAGGGCASALSVEAIHRSLLETQDADLTPITDRQGNSSLAGRRLLIAVQHANGRVREASRADPRLEGMGTTVAAILFERHQPTVAICHVGDSRVYRVRGERIEGLTEDHTVVQWLLKEGRIGPERVKTSPHRHVLTRALGATDIVHPDLRLEQLAPGDVFVLCSDGVHDAIKDDEIPQVLHHVGGNLEAACTRLIDLANQRGGKDNSTVVIVSCDGHPEATTHGVHTR